MIWLAQIFISHSQRDKEIRDFFDRIFAGSSVKAKRIEFEEFDVTPSRYIKEQIAISDALFVLLGPNITFSEYTENWVGFEIGLAAAVDWKVIWVFEPVGADVRFPIPYLHHYVLYDPDDDTSRRYITSIVKQYERTFVARRFPSGVMDVTCPYDNCGAQYRLHTQVQNFNCPACRQNINVS